MFRCCPISCKSETCIGSCYCCCYSEVFVEFEWLRFHNFPKPVKCRHNVHPVLVFPFNKKEQKYKSYYIVVFSSWNIINYGKNSQKAILHFSFIILDNLRDKYGSGIRLLHLIIYIYSKHKFKFNIINTKKN